MAHALFLTAFVSTEHDTAATHTKHTMYSYCTGFNVHLNDIR